MQTGVSNDVTMISTIKFESALFRCFNDFLSKLIFLILYSLFCISLLDYDTDYTDENLEFLVIFYFFSLCIYSYIHPFIYYFNLLDSSWNYLPNPGKKLQCSQKRQTHSMIQIESIIQIFFFAYFDDCKCRTLTLLIYNTLYNSNV